MKKLAKYLRPYLGLTVLCVALLFGQTVCDLTLPNLMSDIVNVGIQQGGVEESAPKAISRQGLSFLEVFLSGEDAARLEGCYETVAAGSDSILTDSYPAAAQEDICVLREGGETEAQELFGKAAAAMTKSAELMMDYTYIYSEPSGGEAQDAQTGETQMDVQALYSMQPLFEQLPQETMEETRSYAQALDSSMREQIATALIRPFYEELGVDTDGMRSGYILRVGLQMLLVTLAGAACTILVGFNASRIAAGVARSMRRDVFATVESFGSAEFDRYSTASLITRTTNDITQVQMLIVMGLRLICYAPIMAIGGSAMALQKSVSMSGIIVVGALFLIGIIAVVFSISRPKFQIVQKLIDRLNLVTRENLSGMMVIRAFGTQEQEEKRFDKSNRDLTSVNLFVNRVMVFLMPAMMFCMNAINLVIVWVGAHQIEAAAMQVGDMMAFMQYAMQVIMSFLMISMMFIMVPRAAVAGDRVAEVLETVPSVQDPVSPNALGRRRAEWNSAMFPSATTARRRIRCTISRSQRSRARRRPLSARQEAEKVHWSTWCRVFMMQPKDRCLSAGWMSVRSRRRICGNGLGLSPEGEPFFRYDPLQSGLWLSQSHRRGRPSGRERGAGFRVYRGKAAGI